MCIIGNGKTNLGIGKPFDQILPDLYNLGFEVEPVRLLKVRVVYAGPLEQKAQVDSLVHPVSHMLDDVICFIVALFH